MIMGALSGLTLAGAAAAFTLEPSVFVTSEFATHLDAGGETVTITWGSTGAAREVAGVTSGDRGVTFGPREVIQAVPPTLGAYRRLAPAGDAAVRHSADGTIRVVLGSVTMKDVRLPPVYSSQYLTIPVEYSSLATWRSDFGGPWLASSFVDWMTDRCDAGGSRCAKLGEVGLALSDDASVGWAAYCIEQNYYHPGQMTDVLVTPVVMGGPAGPVARMSDVPVHGSDCHFLDVATDASGSTVLVAWGPYVHLTRSVDGGVSWTELYLPYENSSDIEIVRDTGLTVLATGAWDPLVIGSTWIQIRTSLDGGATFDPPVVVDATPSIQVDRVRLAVSRDGSTMALLYGVGGPTGDVVLTVSEDGGGTWSRVGVVGRWTSTPTFDLAMSSEGDEIYVTRYHPQDGTRFSRAVR
ncbi:MAG: exo-alpha-sialidase [Alphaproteobacteria bacterium]|nr:exo-alpha-sialidase [Alphaproteobacteria bacterium]MCB9699891.1 exo-alpha-sialidase [Alphaproteobacteria bacterium]